MHTFQLATTSSFSKHTHTHAHIGLKPSQQDVMQIKWRQQGTHSHSQFLSLSHTHTRWGWNHVVGPDPWLEMGSGEPCEGRLCSGQGVSGGVVRAGRRTLQPCLLLGKICISLTSCDSFLWLFYDVKCSSVIVYFKPMAIEGKTIESKTTDYVSN